MSIRRDDDAIEGALIMSRYIDGDEAEVEALASNRQAEMECLRAIDPVAAAKAERAFVGDVELVGIICASFEQAMEAMGIQIAA